MAAKIMSCNQKRSTKICDPTTWPRFWQSIHIFFADGEQIRLFNFSECFGKTTYNSKIIIIYLMLNWLRITVDFRVEGFWGFGECNQVFNTLFLAFHAKFTWFLRMKITIFEILSVKMQFFGTISLVSCRSVLISIRQTQDTARRGLTHHPSEL